ncbi:cell division ATP-binding protein FtsE [Candidatus Poribacteria bacterium]|nr:cell division ATP-binding protein FtsE [Candidatus Poribacteria bacterium]
MIEVFEVGMSYKRHIDVLHDISFQVEKGEFVFLVGPSGAGKTTVLRILCRELIPTSGQIIIAGQNLSRLSRAQIPYLRRKIGMVFQDFKLLPNKTVQGNIALAMKVAGTPRSEIRLTVNQLLHQMSLVHRRDALPEEISGGEQQRVAIARAIANNPSVLLADEPTGNLDPKLSLEIMHLFENFNFQGTTVLVATHDLALVQQLGKRVIRIEDGRIVEQW